MNVDAALEAHRAALGACRRCALPPDVQPIVSLARRTRVMLVGQAPGKVEAYGGKAFAGRAGRTLFRWLERAGLDEASARRAIYIAAVTRCFPGAHPSGRGDRVPSPAERANCAGWLDAELTLIRPRVIVPVGRLAIERFLPARPLADLIGEEHRVAYGEGRSRGVAIAIPLPHPSGASSWIHQDGHMALLDRAIGLLAARFEAMGLRTGARHGDARRGAA